MAQVKNMTNICSSLCYVPIRCPGIESWLGEVFHTCPDRPWSPPHLLYNGYWVFPRG